MAKAKKRNPLSDNDFEAIALGQKKRIRKLREEGHPFLQQEEENLEELERAAEIALFCKRSSDIEHPRRTRKELIRDIVTVLKSYEFGLDATNFAIGAVLKEAA